MGNIINPFRFAVSGTGLSYPMTDVAGAWGGWSVAKKMRSAYSGPIIRVRRSSDNAEADIGVTAGDVLDEAAVATHCGASNGFLPITYDQSGNGRDLVQATAGTQPQIYNGSVVLKGNTADPAAYFNGSHLLKTASATANQSLMVYWVGENDTWVSGNSLFDGNTINSMLCYQYDTSAKLAFYAGANMPNSVDDYGLDLVFILTGRFDVGNSFMKKNNGTARAPSSPGSSPAAGFTVGGRGDGSSKSLIRWSEAILYASTAHDDTTQSTIVTGLNDFYEAY